jgi:uncharacterized protein (DUF1778 family)
MEKVRSRLVTFRVSDEEFQNLKTAATVQSARCLSDFVRHVALQSVRAGAADPVAGQLFDLDRRLAQLESDVARIAKAVDGA